MWIKQVKKSNSPKGKTFLQYQLTETYRVAGVVKHKSVLYLGYHPLLEDKQNRQKVAKLLEGQINNATSLWEGQSDVSSDLTRLAEQYYRKYLLKNQIIQNEKVATDQTDIHYELIDTGSTQVFDPREIGSEWMCYEMLSRLKLKEFLHRQGWSGKWIDYALISIVSRAVFCSSEHKTADWLTHNSGLLELFNPRCGDITRHHLYKASSLLYELKQEMETYLYNRATDMFNLQDSLLIYDLTNTYFEGRKVGSKIARFGRSKEKRNDCRQVVLAAVINQYGFLKHSRIFQGNMADPVTLKEIIENIQGKDKQLLQKQTIVIDAGIATEANLEMLRQEKLKYVCVSRCRLKDYQAVSDDSSIKIRDKRDNEIMLKFIENKESKDRWMYVKSKGKNIKEQSMLDKAFERFEMELQVAKEGISKKNGTKKTEKVWERLGRIKERNKRAHKYYDINVRTQGPMVSDIIWKRRNDIEEQSQTGIYFLRTNYAMDSEQELWQVYNTIREVESTFRCLKTDLNLRPIFHQEDEYVEAHLHLGLLAYSIVASVRHMLKQHDIHYDWRNILRIMNTQKAVSVRQKAKGGKEIILRTCSRPTQQALEIYKALNINSIPYKTKKFVVHH